MTKRNKRRRFITYLLLAGFISGVFFAFIFKQPFLYYSKKIYYKLVTVNSQKLQLSKNKTTNLDANFFIPKGGVYGIDISRHQGVINWELVKETRFGGYHTLDFVYIKATESNYWKDKYFKDNWKQAKEFGFLRGAYHFFDPHESASSQMNHFFSEVKLEIGDMPPVLDVEQQSRITVKEYRQLVLECLQKMEKHYKMKPILYVNQQFYDTYFSSIEFESYPIWIARLSKNRPQLSNWVFWQFSHSAIIPGVDEYVDLNVFNGSEIDLKILLKKE